MYICMIQNVDKMNIQEIINQTEKLSAEEQKNLLNYLLIKYLNSDEDFFKQILHNLEKKQLSGFKKRKLGFLENVEYFIADDFDAPLDDLKDYM